MGASQAVPILSVENLPKAVTLYRELFALDVLMKHEWIATLGGGGEARLTLTTADATTGDDRDASLEVEDIDVVHAAAVAADLEIVHPPTDVDGGVRSFSFRDVDKNVVNVLSRRG
jgi:predicted enzyme related to lactoylglutathione lyase